MVMTPGQLTEAARRELAEVLAVMSAEDRGFCEALPGEPFSAEGHGFAWPMGEVDGGRFAFVHLLLPKVKEAGFHSHGADNESTILSGGYLETWRPLAWEPVGQAVRELRVGDRVTRTADEGHWLCLLPGLNYALSCFVLGPKIRDFRWEAPFADGVVGPLHQYRPAP